MMNDLAFYCIKIATIITQCHCYSQDMAIARINEVDTYFHFEFLSAYNNNSFWLWAPFSSTTVHNEYITSVKLCVYVVWVVERIRNRRSFVLWTRRSLANIITIFSIHEFVHRFQWIYQVFMILPFWNSFKHSIQTTQFTYIIILISFSCQWVQKLKSNFNVLGKCRYNV